MQTVFFLSVGDASDASGPLATYRLQLKPNGPSWIDWEIHTWMMSGWEKEKPEVSGYLKWDGCMEFETHMHICGPDFLNELGRLLASVYKYGQLYFDEAEYGPCSYRNDTYTAEPCFEAPPVVQWEAE